MIDNSLGDADYYDQADYAGFGTRILVMLVDFIVILLLGIALWTPFAALLISARVESDPTGIFFLLYFLVIWLYLGPLKRSNFGTLGFKLFGLKLVSAKGGRPTLLNMTMRMVMWAVGPFNLVLDLIWMGADTESQSLRDCYLGTYLIKRTATPIGRAAMHLARYTAMGFIIAYPRINRPKIIA